MPEWSRAEKTAKGKPSVQNNLTAFPYPGQGGGRGGKKTIQRENIIGKPTAAYGRCAGKEENCSLAIRRYGVEYCFFCAIIKQTGLTHGLWRRKPACGRRKFFRRGGAGVQNGKAARLFHGARSCGCSGKEYGNAAAGGSNIMRGI